MTLLIVDDNAAMRTFVRSVVGDLAEQVHECADGAQAVALFADHRHDWVVMDIEMPNLDGIEATRRIKKLAPDARVIILTVFDNPSLRESSQEAGALAYLLKDNLLELRRMLGNRQ